MSGPGSGHASNPDQLMASALGVCWHSPTSDRWPCTTAAPSPPPRDGEACACPTDGFEHEYETCEACHLPVRPAAPSEPPAADSPTTEAHSWWCNMRPGGNHDGCNCRPAAPSESPAARDRYAQCDDTCTVDCGACKGQGRPAVPPPNPLLLATLDDSPAVPLSEPPAETQQDDARIAVERIAQLYRDPTLARFAINDYRDWLAARPSADTETLRARIEALASRYESNGRTREALGVPAWPLNVARDLRAALDAR